MQEFSNFENLQFVKNTKFSKFSQNLSFYYRDLRPKKKLLQFTQKITKKILAGIGEPMAPTFCGLANIDPFLSWIFYGRYPKYVKFQNSEYRGHQLGPKDSRCQSFSFLL
jgi:hypothetical protein